MVVPGFHHLALLAEDVDRLASFYRDVLGLTELRRQHHGDGRLRSVWLGLGSGGFLAVESAEARGAHGELALRPGYHLLALGIAAVDRPAARARLEARGVRVEGESRWTLYFRDPEGNRVGLSHHPEDAQEA